MTNSPFATDNPLDALTPEALRRRTSLKWRAYPPDVLPLWVAEMDVEPAPAIVEAVTEAMRTGDTGYDHGNAYAEALAAFARRRWSWSFDPARTRMVPDVMLGLMEILKVLTGPGDAVVVSPPVYPPFFGFTQNEGRRIVTAPLTADFRLDLDALDAAFAEATGAALNGTGPGSGRRAVYLLCNPHNPTGTVHTREELEALAALARRHGVRIVSDEIHAPITAPHLAYTPIVSVAGAETAIAVLSASKAWNLAGLKAAVAVGGPEAADDLRRIPEEVGHGVGHVSVVAHVAAFTQGTTWLDAVLRGVRRNKLLLNDLLEEHLPQVRYEPTQGTYLAWLDASAVADDPYRFFLDQAKVALNDGRHFGPGGAGHVRLNLGTSQEVLTEAVRRMGEAAQQASASREG